MRARQVLVGLVVLVVLAMFAWALRGRASKLIQVVQDYGWREGVEAVAHKVLHGGEPLVAWEVGNAEDAGLSVAALDAMRDTLASKNTTAFLVARDGRLVYEWYSPGNGANEPRGLAAMAKAVVGTIAVLTAANDGVIDLDEPVANYVPPWRASPEKRLVSLRQLANHASGLDDVIFPPAGADLDAWFADEAAWKRLYYANPNQRFDIALTKVPLLFEPGTAYKYSGIGYYVLAYALASALAEHSDDDLRHWLARRVYGPMGIPALAWQISYGEEYHQDSLDLYTIGSGASFTPRAVARVGQYVVTHWTEPALNPLHERLLSGSGTHRSSVERGRRLVPRFGWWENDNGVWPSLPKDALVGFGVNEEVVAVVPSLQLVVVRMGGSLGPASPAENIERNLFVPLARALR